MREIKFRAYIKRDYNKELVGKNLEVSSLHLKKNKVIIGYSISKSNYGNKSFNYEDIELMQYTGLKDKNGKEIYEGDILKIDNDIKRAYDLKDIMYIDFIEGTFYLKAEKEIKWSILRCLPVLVNIEGNIRGQVIGNIYENPELLEKGE